MELDISSEMNSLKGGDGKTLLSIRDDRNEKSGTSRAEHSQWRVCLRDWFAVSKE